MTSFSLPPLYLVTDRLQTRGRELAHLLQDILPHGRMMIQIREKDLDTQSLLAFSHNIQQVVQPYHVPLLVNDRVDVTLSLNAAGVHLLSNSLPIPQVRPLLHSGQWIGRSVHSLEEAKKAEQDGADFLVLGPIYDTPSKRPFGAPLGVTVLKEACRSCRIPIYAIGGISARRVREIKQAGAFGVAVISALLEAEDVASAAQELFLQLEGEFDQ